MPPWDCMTAPIVTPQPCPFMFNCVHFSLVYLLRFRLFTHSSGLLRPTGVLQVEVNFRSEVDGLWSGSTYPVLPDQVFA